MRGKISFFNKGVSSSDQKPDENIDLMQLYDRIKNNKAASHISKLTYGSKQYNEVKKQQPYITPHGVFDYRSNKGLKKLNCYLLIEIDKKDNRNIDPEQLISKLLSDIYIKFLFRSFSGYPKWMVEIDKLDQKNFNAVVKELTEYFETNYNVKVDSSQSKIAQPCSLPYDPNAYYDFNDEKDIYKPTFKYLNQSVKKSRKPVGNENINPLAALYEVVKMIEWDEGTVYEEGTRHNFIFSLAWRANAYGISEEDLTTLLQKEYSGYDAPDVGGDKTVESVYENYTESHGKKKFLKHTQHKAEHIVKRYELAFINNYFYQYTGCYWRQLNEDEVKKLIYSFLNEVFTFNITPHIINSIYDISKRVAHVEEPDLCTYYLNFYNGILQLTDFTFRGHDNDSKQFYMRYIIPGEYDQNSSTPSNFINFLYQLFEHDHDKDEKITFLQEFLGYCLTFDVSYQTSVILQGSGSNGKSLLLDVIAKIIGNENIARIDVPDLDNDFSRIKLMNKTMNICSDIDFNKRVPEEHLKKLIHGDRISASEKYMPVTEFHPTAKIVMVANRYPLTRDTTHGFFRSWEIIKFNRSFNGNQRENYKILLNRLLKEKTEILSWLVQGLKRLYSNKGFTEVPSSQEEMNQYMHESNNIMEFFNDEVTITNNSDDYIEYKGLYDAYKDYCEKYNYKAFSKSKFGRQVKELFSLEYQKKKVDGKTLNIYYGIAVEDSSGQTHVAQRANDLISSECQDSPDFSELESE